MRYRPRADVRNDSEVVGRVDPVDAVNITAADVGADEGNQHVGGVVDECDVYRSTEASDPPWQTAGNSRGASGSGVDARDPSCHTLSNIEGTIGSDGAACAALQARGQQMYVMYCGRRRRARNAARRRDDQRGQGRGEQQHSCVAHDDLRRCYGRWQRTDS
jgi:hypothetical protein